MRVKEEIERRLADALTPQILDLVDESHLHAGHREAGDAVESHFRLTIAAPALEGLRKVQQHQAIYRALHGLIPTPIHALAIHVLPCDDA